MTHGHCGTKMDSGIKRLIGIVGVCLWIHLIGASASAAIGIQPHLFTNIEFPRRSGVVNVVTRYGAVGNGRTDDTAAIQRAIHDNEGKFRILYFPNGTYLVSRPLTLGRNLAKCKQIVFQGQSERSTIFRLADHSPAFSSSAHPRPILSFFDGPSTGQAFHNAVYDLTFDTGRGNPGAIGLEFINNNQGGVFNVTIESGSRNGTGVTGLDLDRRWPGPGLIQNLTVRGFDVGIYISQYDYSMVLDRIDLSGQHVCGIEDENEPVTIRHLISHNHVPVINVLQGLAQMAVYHSQFFGGDATRPAIINRGMLILQDVSQQSYAEMVRNVNTGTPQSLTSGAIKRLVAHHVNLYLSRPGRSLFGAKPRMLDLPVQSPPVVPWAAPGDWVRVALRKHRSSTSAIQAAFDLAAREHKSTVYFPGGRPQGTYTIRRTIIVHGSVRRVIGLESNLTVASPLLRTRNPVFLIRNLTHKALVFERFWMTPWKATVPYPMQFVWFRNRTPAALILKHLMANAVLYKTARGGSGPLFIQDVTTSGPLFLSAGQKAWAWQYNPEAEGTLIHCNRAQFWICGLKTEGRPIVADISDHSKLKVLGAYIYPSWAGSPQAAAMWRIRDSQASLVYVEGALHNSQNYPVEVAETLGPVTRLLRRGGSGYYYRGAGDLMPLFYSGRSDNAGPK